MTETTTTLRVATYTVEHGRDVTLCADCATIHRLRADWPSDLAGDQAPWCESRYHGDTDAYASAMRHAARNDHDAWEHELVARLTEADRKVYRHRTAAYGDVASHLSAYCRLEPGDAARGERWRELVESIACRRRSAGLAVFDAGRLAEAGGAL
jgi:hypothetical protein